MKITPDLFQQPPTAISIRNIAQRLGELSGYMLNANLCQELGIPVCPPLPIVVGGCWPILAVRNRLWSNFTWPAFILPLQWYPATDGHEGDDRRLPPAILQVADQVRRDMGQSPAEFKLSFVHRQKIWPDLSQFDNSVLEASSCYPALAMGLRSAISRFPANGQVWASACWQGQFVPADLLPQKLETATRWQCKWFFVAPDSAIPDGSVPHNLQIEYLATASQGNAEKALAKMFAAGLLEPDPQHWPSCRDYHQEIRKLDNQRAADYYDRVLFRHIVERSRQSQITVPEVIAQPRYLITIATKNHQPVKVITAALGISHVLVLYSDGPDNMRDKALELVRDMQRAIPHVVVESPRSFAYDPESPAFPRDTIRSLRQAIEPFLHGIPDDTVVFDIDRGTTMQKILLLQEIVKPQQFLVTMFHRQTEGNLIEHGSERIMLWPAHYRWPVGNSPAQH